MNSVAVSSSTAKGCIYGALIGDAAGATLEFSHGTPSRTDVKVAMSLIGGGILGLAPGQITDDGEMTLSLMYALAGTNTFSIERVAQSYLRWKLSAPFDIGYTTRKGLSGGFDRAAINKVHIGMWETAKLGNIDSKANGSLMRIAPLGVWGYRLSEEDLVDAASMDSRLTHPNPTCQQASALYCVAIRQLMLHPHDGKGAVESVRFWIDRLNNKEIAEWFCLAEKNIDIGYTPQIGFVKYAFTHAFRHLLLGTSYLDALFETLMGGGDTDTNACIVGGLVGALHGVEAIPKSMINSILSCDISKGRSRPDFLQTRKVLPGLIDSIMGNENAPK